MDTKSKTILENGMIISEIEKKWNCSTDRAVILFCRALGIRKPNTDKLDAWSKHQLRKFLRQTTGANDEKDHCNHNQAGCSSCKSCHGSCGC